MGIGTIGLELRIDLRRETRKNLFLSSRKFELVCPVFLSSLKRREKIRKEKKRGERKRGRGGKKTSEWGSRIVDIWYNVLLGNAFEHSQISRIYLDKKKIIEFSFFLFPYFPSFSFLFSIPFFLFLSKIDKKLFSKPSNSFVDFQRILLCDERTMPLPHDCGDLSQLKTVWGKTKSITNNKWRKETFLTLTELWFGPMRVGK